MSVASWLQDLGLAQYAETFEREAIDIETLPELDERDLLALGVPLGHRKRILRAIAALTEFVAERAGEAERRHITVMFCDLAGSTALSERLDPEDLRDLLQAYQAACVAPAERLGGHVAKYIGDGLLIYFGYPQAHEDDAARAVGAALEIMEAVRQVDTPSGEALEAHIGIHSGLVVAGEIGAGATREARAITGRTPNIAARLEALAAPGEVLISDATKRLVEGLFDCDALGPQSLKGIDDPILVHRVRTRTGARSRFEVAWQRGLSPIVGREEELALLQARWERAALGEGQVFLLCGEAGIGKSRIVRQLCETIGGAGGREVVLQCSAHHANSALYPFAEELERSAGFGPGDDAAARAAKLEAAFGGVVSAAALRKLWALFSLSVERDDAKEDAETRRRQSFAAVLERLSTLCAETPLCLVFEDAHWADPSSNEMLDRIIDLAQSTRILLVITFRPGFDTPWEGRPHTTMLTLNRLSRAHSHQIVAALVERLDRTGDLAERIVQRAEGVPLFLEELARTVLETGDTPADAEIPATLDASLTARLDQLGPTKEVAQAGAVIGREFSADLLAEALDEPASALVNSLSRLVASGLVYPRGGGDDSVYVFKHALVQDAAYNSLLKSARRRLHGRVADALLRNAGSGAVRFEAVAHHLTAAERPDEAAEMWLRAGRDAQERSADKEAVAHFHAGLGVLVKLPESPDRDARELAFRLALSPLLLATQGWGALETSQSYAATRELCRRTGAREVLPPVVYGEYLIFVAKADYMSAYSAANELLALAEELGDEAGRIQGHRIFAWCSLYLGSLDDAESHADRVLSLYDPSRHDRVALGYGYDPRVAGLSVRTIARSIRGDDATAGEAARESLRYARVLGHAGSLGYALMFSGALPAAMRSDRAAARDYAYELAALATEQGNPLWKSYSDVILGWVAGNRPGDGIAQLERGLAQLATSARNPWYPVFLALLAEVWLRSGDAAKALHILDEAATSIDHSSERNWEAEICRLKGLALIESSSLNLVEAREWVLKAVAIAQNQGASVLVARAKNDLAALPGV